MSPFWKEKLTNVVLLVGGVFVAFAPLLFGAWLYYIHSKEISWLEVFGAGEGFLIANALAADALMRCFRPANKSALSPLFGLFALAIIMMTSLEFAGIASDVFARRARISAHLVDATTQNELQRLEAVKSLLKEEESEPYDKARTLHDSLLWAGTSIIVQLGVILVVEQ